jgi:hypothetical protein
MAPWAWLVCIAWLALATAIAASNALHAKRNGTLHKVKARLASPTPYLFAAYLLVAGLVTDQAPGESTSPLLWLALALPIAFAQANLAALGPASTPWRALRAAIFGGQVLAASAIVLALSSPAFVPSFLR